MGRVFPMTGVIVNLICHLTFSGCVDSRRIPRTLVVGVCQNNIQNSFKNFISFLIINIFMINNMNNFSIEN